MTCKTRANSSVVALASYKVPCIWRTWPGGEDSPGFLVSVMSFSEKGNTSTSTISISQYITHFLFTKSILTKYMSKE